MGFGSDERRPPGGDLIRIDRDPSAGFARPAPPRKVALNVGFYYMANAGGRLTGTLLSGLMFQLAGVAACLWASTAFALAAASSLSSCRPSRPPICSRA